MVKDAQKRSEDWGREYTWLQGRMSLCTWMCAQRCSAKVRAALQASPAWQMVHPAMLSRAELMHIEVASVVQYWAKLPAAAEVTEYLKRRVFGAP